MSASRAAQRAATVTRTLAARSVKLDVNPPPRTLHERRGILRVLKEFGEVVHFKSLRDDPEWPAQNVILAIYQLPEAAQKLKAESPLQFRIDPPPKPRATTTLETMELFQLAGDGTPRLSFDEDTPPPARDFQMTADTSKADLLGRIRRHKYYWDFEVKKRSFAQEELAKRVPLEAVSDTELEPGQTPQRIVNRKMMNVANNQSLRQLWLDGQQLDGGQQERRQEPKHVWAENYTGTTDGRQYAALDGLSDPYGKDDGSRAREFYNRRRTRKTAGR